MCSILAWREPCSILAFNLAWSRARSTVTDPTARDSFLESIPSSKKWHAHKRLTLSRIFPFLLPARGADPSLCCRSPVLAACAGSLIWRPRIKSRATGHTSSTEPSRCCWWRCHGECMRPANRGALPYMVPALTEILCRDAFKTLLAKVYFTH